jgi:hypothetical protein
MYMHSDAYMHACMHACMYIYQYTYLVLVQPQVRGVGGPGVGSAAALVRSVSSLSAQHPKIVRVGSRVTVDYREEEMSEVEGRGRRKKKTERSWTMSEYLCRLVSSR